MTTDFHYDVFLSHNSADKLWVRWLAERLRAAGSNFAPRPSDIALPNAVLFRDQSNAGRRSMDVSKINYALLDGVQLYA